jgi:death-on-curing protein
MELYFLTLEDVLEIHTDQINRYGGKKGIRDQNLLLSAIAQPLSTFDGQYLHNPSMIKLQLIFFIFARTIPLLMVIKG